MEFDYCSIPSLSLFISGVVLNIAMLFYVRKTKITNPVLYSFIAFTNAFASAVQICVKFKPTVNVRLWSPKTTSVYHVLSLSAVLMTRGANISLAFARLHSLTSTADDSNQKRKFETKLVASTVAAALVISSLPLALPPIFNNFVFAMVVMFGSRVITLVLLCVVYIEIILLVRKFSKDVAERSENNEIEMGGRDESEEPTRQQQRRAKDQEKILTALFIGIIVSYFVFTLPPIALIAFKRPACGTVGGILYSIGEAFFPLNVVFDPVWFFHQWRKLKRQLRATHAAIPVRPAV